VTTKYSDITQRIFIVDLLSVTKDQPVMGLTLGVTDDLLHAHLPLPALFGLLLAAAEEAPNHARHLLDSIEYCFKAAMYACPLKEPSDLYAETRSIWEWMKSSFTDVAQPSIPQLAAEWLQQKYVEIITAEKGHERVR